MFFQHFHFVPFDNHSRSSCYLFIFLSRKRHGTKQRRSIGIQSSVQLRRITLIVEVRSNRVKLNFCFPLYFLCSKLKHRTSHHLTYQIHIRPSQRVEEKEKWNGNKIVFICITAVKNQSQQQQQEQRQQIRW